MDDADAGGESVFDSLAHLRPGRVDASHQAKEGEVGLDCVRRVGGELRRQLTLADREDSQRLPGQSRSFCAVDAFAQLVWS